MSGQGKILLVEDDMQVQINNKEMLERNGYTVLLAMNLAGAREAVREQAPDAIVLDITLPDGDGVDFLGELRQTKQIPVLMLTAAKTPEKAAASLDEGSDDYLRKPYDLKEFRARVDALMRRASKVPERILKGPLQLDVLAGQAFLGGGDLLLAQKEFALLLLFSQNEGKTMSAEYIYEKVWKQPLADDDGALKNTVYKLRKKLNGSGYVIKNERGGGYGFARG
jgi:DNA-binding response OmpR family regulator